MTVNYHTETEVYLIRRTAWLIPILSIWASEEGLERRNAR